MAHRTTPVLSKKMPGGIPFIIGNEAAERFSYYGMKGILTVFMTKHLVDSSGEADFMTDEEAKTVYHLFAAAAYFFPIVGALIADIFWGKYKTIIILSIGYCIGHGFLALGDTGAGSSLLEPRMWLFLGLLFIALGAGGSSRASRRTWATSSGATTSTWSRRSSAGSTSRSTSAPPPARCSRRSSWRDTDRGPPSACPARSWCWRHSCSGLVAVASSMSRPEASRSSWPRPSAPTGAAR